jgi:Tfp pilus assembly protein PilX
VSGQQRVRDRVMGLRREGRGEDGIALITAVLIAFIVVTLGIASVQLAIHNSEASGHDRRRTQAIAAAEAGIDYYLSHLSSTTTTAVQCSISGTLPGTPEGTFSITTTFYNAAGNPLPTVSGSQCPLGSTPASVLIRSVGRASANTRPARTMQAYANLSPGVTAPFNNTGAIFGQNNITISATSRLGGQQYSDADLYSNGNVSVSSGSILFGNVYNQGTLSLNANSEVKRDAWANGSVTLVGSARVRGNATSSTSSITLGGQSRIYGFAKAATTVSGGTVDGTIYQNSPSGPPPSRPYPAFTYNPSDWIAAGYTIRDYTSCTTAVTDMGTWWGSGSGSNVVRVTGGCAMSFPNGSTTTVRGNLAIITDGSITLQNNARFVPASGTGPWNLHFFVGLSGLSGCHFTANPNSGTNSGLNTLVYTHQACTVNFSSNSAIAEGQIIGGTVDIKQSTSFNYRQVAVPGNPGSAGLKQDVRYRREVVTS